MPVTKTDLRLGNIFKEGVVCKINGRAGAKVHLCGQLEYKNGELRNRTEVAVEYLTPIELSSEVLVEWCGFEDMDAPSMFNHFTLHLMEIYTDRNGMFWYNPRQGNSVNLQGLHELQNLYHALNKRELEIRE